MADSALILMQGETGLLPAGANAAVNGMGQGPASSFAGPEGGFSGMLQARMAGHSPPNVSKVVAGNKVGCDPARPAQVSPPGGKLLPGQEVDLTQAGIESTRGMVDATGISVLSLLYGQATQQVGESLVDPDVEVDDSLMAIEEATADQQGLASLIQQTLTSRANSPQGTLTERQPSLGQLPAAWYLTTQAGKPPAGLETLLSSPATLDDDNALQQLVTQTGQLNRPLTAIERMTLEQVRLQSHQQHAAGQNENTTSGLTRHILAAAGLESRSSAMDGVMQGVMQDASASQSRFRHIMDQLQPQVLSPAQPVDAGANGSLVATIDRSAGMSSIPTLTVATPVGQAGWGSEMGQRVTWMANSELREAQIQLHPRHLGPVEVKISFGQDQQLHVTFTAAHQVTREALDAALPRLREMFEQQGMNLADANVSRESFADRQDPGHQGNNEDNDSHFTADPLQSLLTPQEGTRAEDNVPLGSGLIDAYA